ncbi:unnamed protein product, partial [Porites lobata]
KTLGALKRDIQDESCSNTDSVAKKLKEESKITFRFEGNKKQFQFNPDLAEKRKLDLVKTHLEELDSDIKKRNKLIRLADKYAAGWDLVNEYLSDELASGSEDEKRIRRAEQRALRKRNHRQQKAKPSKQGYSQLQSSTATTAFAGQHSSSSKPISPNQDQVIFVSPAASNVIGDLSVKLILKPDLQARGRSFLVLLVFRALEWVPRELNACADAISHIVDFDDWYTTPEFFAHLDRLWGPHTVDSALQPNFQQVEDGRLRALVQDLPAVLLKSKADSTARNLIQESASCSTIDEVHYGLKWVQDLAGLPDPSDSEEFMFRPLVFLRSTGAYKLRGSVPLSYTRAREIVLSAFDSIGLPKQDYGLHSLRAGGASAAANARAPDRLFKRHGRWKSDKAKDGYIKDSVHSLLSVSLSLGI